MCSPCHDRSFVQRPALRITVTAPPPEVAAVDAMDTEEVQRKSDTQLSNSRATVRGEPGVRDGGFERMGWETGRSVTGTRPGRRRGRLGAPEPRACAVLSRGRQTAHRENRVALKTAWRGVTSRERIGRSCGKERAAEAHERGTVAGRCRVRTPRRAVRCPTRVHTGGPTAGIAPIRPPGSCPTGRAVRGAWRPPCPHPPLHSSSAFAGSSQSGWPASARPASIRISLRR